MTQQREWPNNAKEVRDRAAEEAALALKTLRPILSNEKLSPDEIRRVAVALDCLQTTLRLLESASAQTRP